MLSIISTKCRPKFLKIIIFQKSSKLPTSVTKLCQNAPFFNSKTRAPQQSGRELKQHARARSPNTGRRSAGCAAPASRPAGSPPSIYRRGPAMHVSLRRRIFFAAQNSEEYGVSLLGWGEEGGRGFEGTSSRSRIGVRRRVPASCAVFFYGLHYSWGSEKSRQFAVVKPIPICPVCIFDFWVV